MASKQQEQSGMDLASREAAGMAAIEPTPELIALAYDAIQHGTLPPEVGDPKITASLILQRIREGTFEESLDPTQSLRSLRDFVDTPMIYVGFHLNPSSFRDAKDNASPSSVYAVVEVADPETFETELTQFGGVNVLMQLIKAWEEQKFPFQATLVGAKTGQNFTTYWLRRPGETSEAAA